MRNRCDFGYVLLIASHYLIEGVNKQQLLVGLEGIDQTFAGKRVVFDDIEGAAIERKPAGVLDPQRVQRSPGRTAPESDLLGVNVRINDRDEGRVVLKNRDFLFQVVLEEIAEFLSGGAGDLALRGFGQGDGFI